MDEQLAEALDKLQAVAINGSLGERVNAVYRARVALRKYHDRKAAERSVGLPDDNYHAQYLEETE
jgi:hypothetical protein